MEIILLKDVPGVGKAGSVKKVNDGYALNFLVPKSLAVACTPESLKKLSETRLHEESIHRKQELALIKTANRLKNQVLHIKISSTPEGTLYAAVDAKKIVALIKNRFNVSIPINSVLLGQHIKKIGDYEIALQLTPTLLINFKIKVTADNG